MKVLLPEILIFGFRKILLNRNWKRVALTSPRRRFSMASASEWTGSSGRLYQFKELLQVRAHLGRVWLAISEDEKFVLKDIPEAMFSNFNDLIKPRLGDSPYIRLPCDSIPNERILVYKYHQEGQDINVEQVQIIDLENAAYLPKGRCIKGMLPGNQNWRSPEGHLRGELNKPTDMFSFGALVTIYYPFHREDTCR